MTWAKARGYQSESPSVQDSEGTRLSQTVWQLNAGYRVSAKGRLTTRSFHYAGSMGRGEMAGSSKLLPLTLEEAPHDPRSLIGDSPSNPHGEHPATRASIGGKHTEELSSA